MMGARFPFEHRIAVSSPDFEEASAFISSLIDDREVKPLSAQTATANLISSQQLNDTFLFGGSWSAAVNVSSEELSSVHGLLVLEGAISCKVSGHTATTGSLLLLPPDIRADLIWACDTKAIVTTFARKALLDYFGIADIRKLLRDPRILNADSVTATLFRQTVECLALQHTATGGQVCEKAQKHWEGLLISLLERDIGPVDPDRCAVLPTHIRRARDWIHANITDPIGVSDLLTLTGCGRRSLEAGFRKYLGVSPARYIVCEKMKEIREVLKQNPALSVSDVAFAFGFSHPSHFTRKYKELFGELPSETARHRCVSSTGQ